MPVLTVRVPRPLFIHIDETAILNGVSRSHVVQRVLMDVFFGPEASFDAQTEEQPDTNRTAE